jgi:tetratricopeptide (TPR) repeat protein
MKLPASLRRSLVALLCASAVAVALPSTAQSLGPGIVATPQQPPSREDTSGLTADIFYRVILGDVALQRGEASLAARAYYEAARDSRDPRLARRAAEVAFAARMRGLTQEAAKLWATLDPAAERPKQMMAAMAAAGAARGEVAPIDGDVKSKLEKAIAEASLTERGNGEMFLELNRMLRDALDKRQVYELVRDLAKPYPNSAEAHFAVALAAYNGGAPEGTAETVALTEADRALAIKPDWERAALLKADVLARKKPDDAIAFLVQFTKANPDARSAAGALAQLYVERKRYAEARTLFQRLWDGDRSAREFEFGVAVISMQMKDWDQAESLFNDLKRANYGDNGAVELYLAQIAEERGNYAEAVERYKAVPESERGWLAKLRVAAMMAKQGKVAEARKYLGDLPAVTIEQRVQVRQAEAQLLRDTDDLAGAYAVLGQGLKEHPDSPELLYDMAMVAEKLDKLDDAEARLRRVVELKPDDAQSLNALGYTLVDRTQRTAEGLALIERAHKLSPDDPFILDSMGWAMFKLGRYSEAERYLRRAMEERPDAEIAAHLGEVLWAAGERDRAQEVWQSQLKVTPDNVLLLETVRRLAR